MNDECSGINSHYDTCFLFRLIRLFLTHFFPYYFVWLEGSCAVAQKFSNLIFPCAIDSSIERPKKNEIFFAHSNGTRRFNCLYMLQSTNSFLCDKPKKAPIAIHITHKHTKNVEKRQLNCQARKKIDILDEKLTSNVLALAHAIPNTRPKHKHFFLISFQNSAEIKKKLLQSDLAEEGGKKKRFLSQSNVPKKISSFGKTPFNPSIFEKTSIFFSFRILNGIIVITIIIICMYETIYYIKYNFWGVQIIAATKLQQQQQQRRIERKNEQ